jgi:hypothetical protein
MILKRQEELMRRVLGEMRGKVAESKKKEAV